MPHRNLKHLPSEIRHALPPRAQKLYKDIFNKVAEQFDASSDYEPIAHQIAWDTLKRKYRTSKIHIQAHEGDVFKGKLH